MCNAVALQSGTAIQAQPVADVISRSPLALYGVDPFDLLEVRCLRGMQLVQKTERYAATNCNLKSPL